MPDTSVKFFHSGQPGAPVLSGTAGSLLSVLDAALVHGFGLAGVTSLAVSGGVATLTVSGGHAAEVGSVVLVDGATPSPLNGQKKVASVGAGNTTLTFDATGVADGSATGTITVKLAGAGWEKEFFGTNLAVYKIADVTGSGCRMRVDDTAGKTARVVGYETMTGISAGTGPFPTVAQRSGGVWWTKSGTADSTARPWACVADARVAYLWLGYHAATPLGGALVAFGDLAAAKSGDAWACALSGYPSDLSGSAPGNANDLAVIRNAADELYLAKPASAVGGSLTAYKAFPLLVPATALGFASGAGPMPYPNGPDGGLYLSPLHAFESFFHALRGTFPGLWCCPQALPPGLFTPGERLSGAANLLNRDLRVVPFGAASPNGTVVFFDTTGPWR